MEILQGPAMINMRRTAIAPADPHGLFIQEGTDLTGSRLYIPDLTYIGVLKKTVITEGD